MSAEERRLVLMARTLVKQPARLLLDKPCHGLDAAESLRLNHFVDRLGSRAGKTLLYVTHHPDEIPSCVTCRMTLTPGHPPGIDG